MYDFVIIYFTRGVGRKDWSLASCQHFTPAVYQEIQMLLPEGDTMFLITETFY